jgi:hypothetical protein
VDGSGVPTAIAGPDELKLPVTFPVNDPNVPSVIPKEVASKMANGGSTGDRLGFARVDEIEHLSGRIAIQGNSRG